MKTSWLKNVLKGLGIGVGCLAMGLYLLLPAGMGVVTVFPGKETVGLPPSGFEEIVLPTEDQETLAAWYHPESNGAAVIVIHGAGGSREGIRATAEMLARHGYGVLAIDLRGHGQSTGKTNRLGWQGTPDVGAAIRYLLAQSNIKKIGGLGVSMGGEVLLGAVSTYPALQAVVADGATRRCTEELLALPSERPLVRNFTARVMYATVQMLSGEQPPKPLLDSMLEAPNARFLWIAAGNQKLEVQFNQLFADTIGERGSLWIAPDVAHTGAFYRFPAEYEQRVIGFFDQVFRNP